MLQLLPVVSWEPSGWVQSWLEVGSASCWLAACLGLLLPVVSREPCGWEQLWLEVGSALCWLAACLGLLVPVVSREPCGRVRARSEWGCFWSHPEAKKNVSPVRTGPWRQEWEPACSQRLPAGRTWGSLLLLASPAAPSRRDSACLKALGPFGAAPAVEMGLIWLVCRGTSRRRRQR